MRSPNILLVGAGNMSSHYLKVLHSLRANVTLVGRSKERTEHRASEYSIQSHAGGLNHFIQMHRDQVNSFDAAIIAVNEDQAPECILNLIQCGINSILVEKPAALDLATLKNLVSTIGEKGSANVKVAYNRRYFGSTSEVLAETNQGKLITSINFEFTEWVSRIPIEQKSKRMLESWILLNSSHVIDLAFYLGGSVRSLSCFAQGKDIDWHPAGSRFSGAGISHSNVLYSYKANWSAPGRWGIEVLTPQKKYYLSPMEELSQQCINSVEITPLKFDNHLDLEFKPGLFKMVQAFLNGSDLLPSLSEHLDNAVIFQCIKDGGSI